MNDKELFNEVLANLVDTYGIEVDRAFGDSYLVFRKDDDIIGEMNPSGYNLLANLTKLCNILKDELR